MIEKLILEHEALLDALYQLKNQLFQEEMEIIRVKNKLIKDGFDENEIEAKMVDKTFILNSIKNDVTFTEESLELLKIKEELILEFGDDILGRENEVFKLNDGEDIRNE